MAVRMRLRRMGHRNRPFYRICVIEKSRARDAEYIESIGHYDPYAEDKNQGVSLDAGRAEYWLGVGATPSETVASFLRAKKVPGIGAAPKKAKKKRRNKPTPATRKKMAEKSGKKGKK